MRRGALGLTLLLGLLLGAPARGRAQWYSCAGRARCLPADEWVAGAGLNLLSRGPWVAKPWRRPLPRLLWTTALSAFYESVLDFHGWENRDFFPRLGGYLLTETVIALIRRRP